MSGRIDSAWPSLIKNGPSDTMVSLSSAAWFMSRSGSFVISPMMTLNNSRADVENI